MLLLLQAWAEAGAASAAETLVALIARAQSQGGPPVAAVPGTVPQQQQQQQSQTTANNLERSVLAVPACSVIWASCATLLCASRDAPGLTLCGWMRVQDGGVAERQRGPLQRRRL